MHFVKMILFSKYTPDLTALRTESFVVSSWLTDDLRFKLVSKVKSQIFWCTGKQSPPPTSQQNSNCFKTSGAVRYDFFIICSAVNTRCCISRDTNGKSTIYHFYPSLKLHTTMHHHQRIKEGLYEVMKIKIVTLLYVLIENAYYVSVCLLLSV